MKVTLAQINAMSDAAFVSCFGHVAEHAPWVARAAYRTLPFASVDAVDGAMRAAIEEADEAAQRALLCAHPELARPGPLTSESASEQAGHGLDTLADAEAKRFADLNDGYRERFGFPFIIAVRGQKDRAAILAALEERLTHGTQEELHLALDEVCRIVRFRLDDIIESEPEQTVPQGRLTVHVLDMVRGGAAVGLAIALERIVDSGREALGRWLTNADGRCDAPLLAGDALLPGSYEVLFDVGGWRQVTGGDAGFYDVVPIRFRVTDASAHYHVPLLLAPYGYSTYRGS